MQITKTIIEPLGHVPRCRVTLGGLILLATAVGFASCSVELPRGLLALLLTAGFIGTIFGIGLNNHIDYSENGETA